MFEILFKGECQPQQDLDKVKQNMAQLFKISAEKAEVLFNGQSMTLKRDLDKALASKYIQAINRAGAIAYAVESSAESEPPSPAPQSVAPEPAVKVEDSGQVNAEQEVATEPVAEAVPEVHAEPIAEVVEEDAPISVLEAELDPPGTTLLKHEVVQTPDIDTAQLSLSQPGETLTKEADVADADIEISHLSLSDSGSDLSDK